MERQRLVPCSASDLPTWPTLHRTGWFAHHEYITEFLNACRCELTNSQDQADKAISLSPISQRAFDLKRPQTECMSERGASKDDKKRLKDVLLMCG